VPVPERDCETEVLVAAADPGETVFVPAIGPAASVVVRKVSPDAAISAIALTDDAPGALVELGSPMLSTGTSFAAGQQTLAFRWSRRQL
jgi:hypothetical protein